MTHSTITLLPYPTYKDSGVPWLGDVPAHWEIIRFKSKIDSINEQVGSKDDSDIYIALEHVESWTGRLNLAETETAFESQVKRFKRDDVLFGKLRPYLAKVARPTQDGVCVGEFLVLRPRTPSVSSLYLERLLRSKRVIDEIDSSTFGAKMPRADWQFVGNLRIPLPPLPEQHAIARFLDHIDGRVNRFIRAKRKLIALLNEQKQAIIHRAVTRGLDPDVALRPSGVEWLGEIPAHWEVVRSKRIFSPRKELARPDDIQLSATQAYGVIPQEEYEKRVGRRIVKIFLHLEKRRHVEVGDFVISMRSFQGGLERAWASGCIRSSYVVLQPSHVIDVDYFSYVFKSPAYISALQSTANFIRDGQDLNFENFCGVDLAVPPKDQQGMIARYIWESTADLTRVSERTQREIDLIREYRTRLIADVVTGKLDVRAAAAGLPEEPVEDEPEAVEEGFDAEPEEMDVEG